MFTWYREADRKTRRIFWTCSAGWAMDMADSVVYSYLIPLLMTGLGMTLVQAGVISSANFSAAAIGGAGAAIATAPATRRAISRRLAPP